MPVIECLAALGRQADVEAAIRRDPSAFADAIRHAPHVPQPLSDAAISVGGEWIGALARNTDAVAEDPVLRRRLAGTGHPLVARAVFENEYGPWDSVDLRVLPAAADGADPDWKPRLSRLRALTRTRENEGRLGAVALLRATVVAPFPKLVTAALASPDVLDRAEQLRGLLSLYAFGGPKALCAALADPDVARELRRHAGTAHTDADDGEADDAAELAAWALGDPDRGVEALRRAVAAAEGVPDGLTEDYLNPWNPLDWSALLAAHTRGGRSRPG
ncbi:hypothetical protein ACIBSV_11165 [Embleya sp. NPDC050154]|uniref:hypothetical protein n=1 Tax=Embleya sp. NPDC050154 TaxID=3363988 RepID=UPI0037AD8FE1